MVTIRLPCAFHFAAEKCMCLCKKFASSLFRQEQISVGVSLFAICTAPKFRTALGRSGAAAIEAYV